MYQPYAVNVPPPERPKILCLHGGGSSSTIFQIQLIRLSRFVFLDGPIETEPGPGVLPVFEGCGPYYRWVSDDPSSPAEELQQQKETAMELLKMAVRRGHGVLAGARAAASLLLEQQRQPFAPNNLFGVFLCGTYPPFVPDDDKILAPSVHVVGLFDPWKPASEELIELCSERSTRKVNIAAMVIDLWKETTGARV
ncbi:oxidoreductase [Colletotrichum tofieldiae]|nr:oxidoreductase [Colletotrichum tofieldiae]